METNPGPKPQATKCIKCRATIRRNQKQLACEMCFNRTHAKCADTNLTHSIMNCIPVKWTCTDCTHLLMPFARENDLNSTISSTISGATYSSHQHALHEHYQKLRVLHINTQSMTSNFNDLLVLLDDHPFDIVCLSETWLKNNANLLEYVRIPGYSMEYVNGDPIRGGGVGIYVNSLIKYRIRKDINDMYENLEHIWIEVDGRNKHSKLLLGVIYRSERIISFSDWLTQFEDVITYIQTTWDGLLLITGYININLLKPECCQVRQYNNILSAFNLKQIVSKPTRMTPLSATLIDHMIINNNTKIAHTDVLPCETISDHDGPYAIINIKYDKFKPRYKMIRDERQFDRESFVSDFSNLPISVIYAIDDPEEKVEILHKFMQDCIDRHAPLRRTKITTCS